MQALLAVSRGIDAVSRAFGVVATALVFLSCMICAGNAFSRYLLSISSNAWLEIQWQLFAGIFLLGAAQVLKVNEHVRVDVIYGGLSDRSKLWVDVFGLVVFLLPAAILIAWLGWPFFHLSYVRNEMSANAGGLPIWPVKLLLPLGFALLALQGVSELIKRVAALRGVIRIQTTYEKPLQ